MIRRALSTFVSVLLLSSCAQFDDSKIWDKITEHEQRIERLEAACDLMNTNISALQAIVTALQGNDFVTGVAEIVEDGKVVGYTITFSKSGVVKIYHGEDGANGADGAEGADGAQGAPGADGADGVDGEDGHSPVVGVRKDADGVYYWTIDGDWMLDSNGQKVPATGKDGVNGEDGTQGKDGVTPLLKIEDGYWFVSYDGGKSWTKLYKAVGENGSDGADGVPGQNGADGKDGESFFQSVDTTSSEDYITLTLSDGTQIKLPTWKAFEELQAMVNKLNTNLSALQTIVDALQNNDYVTGINPVTQDGVEIGYTIDFAKSKSITIYHGKDGTDGSNGADGAPGAPGQDGEAGKDGYTPVLGVKPADDDWSLDNGWNGDTSSQAKYYWTLDGEWLLDENGNRIPASGTNGTNGQNGATPKLKIVDEYWYVSLDGGQTWQPEPLGPATAGAGGSIFTDISYDSAYIYITLSDGEKITLSRSQDKPSTMWSLEAVETTHNSATFQGNIIIPEDALSHTIISIYYSEDKDFSIYTAKSVSSTKFDYNGNFYLTINNLKYNTDYYYCAVVKVREKESYGKMEKFTTYVSGLEVVTKTYSNNGYISVKDGLHQTHNHSWILSDFIEIEKLMDNEEGACTSRLQGNSNVANIAYYSTEDLASYISGITYTAGQNRSYTSKEIKDAAPAGAKYAVFSTHINFAPLQITMIEDINNALELKYVQIAGHNDFNINGFVRPSGTFSDYDAYIRTDYIDIQDYGFDYIEARVHPYALSVSPIVFFDAEKNYIGGYNSHTIEEGSFRMTVPSNAAYVMSASFRNSDNPLEVYGVYEINEENI